MNWKNRIILNVVMLAIAIIFFAMLGIILSDYDIFSSVEQLQNICGELQQIDSKPRIVLSILSLVLVVVYFYLLYEELKKFSFRGTWHYMICNKVNGKDHIVAQGEMTNYALSEVMGHMKQNATSKIKWGPNMAFFYDTNHNKIVFRLTDFDE